MVALPSCAQTVFRKSCHGDVHVEEELQRIEPDLAAPTRSVQPAQAQLLGLIPSQSDRVQTFQQIVMIRMVTTPPISCSCL